MSINVIHMKNSAMHQSDNNNNNRADEMIEEIATVMSVGSGYAEILPEAGTSCSSCASTSSCSSSVSAFNFFTGKKTEPRTLRVINTVAARPGDKVIVGVKPNSILKGSVLAYLLPLLSLILLSIVGNTVFGWAGLNQEAGSILGGLSGLVLSFHWLATWLKTSEKARHMEVFILRIKEPDIEPVLFHLPG
jgi:sigma-E factor negative regulatory protein RseC